MILSYLSLNIVERLNHENCIVLRMPGDNTSYSDSMLLVLVVFKMMITGGKLSLCSGILILNFDLISSIKSAS